MIGSRLEGEGNGRVLLVTSSLPGEGKSLLCLALARALAFSGRRTLLIDVDPWRPSVGRLAKRLTMELTEDKVAGLEVALDQASGLSVAIPGEGTAGTQQAAHVRNVTASLEGLRAAYDVILLDAPPVLAVPDVLPAAAAADATILVVRFEGPGSAAVTNAIDKLEGVGAKLAGTVLSRVSARLYRRYGYGPVLYSR